MNVKISSLLVTSVLLMACAYAQEIPTDSVNVIIPQSRVICYPCPRPIPQPVQISGVAVNISIQQQVATTTMEISLRNNAPRPQEAQMLVPVPDGAAIRSFGFDGVSKEPNAKILPKAEAEAIYRSIVNKLRDPALLEFAGYNLVRSSVFPVPANATQKVTLVYENLLPADGERIDYVLPRSESFASQNIPWQITVDLNAKQTIATVYSPTHFISSNRISKERFRISLGDNTRLEPGPFRLSYLLEQNGVTASLLAYPDPSVGGGYFMLLGAVPAVRPEKSPSIKREVIIVLDRSGSMQGEKIEQARAAALQVVNGLNDGESFNIIDYSDSVASFAEQAVVKNAKSIEEARAYIRRINSAGGTNIHDALLEALRPEPTAKTLPLVLFLTDGLPTVGERREAAIREAVKQGNKYNRRIFTFGVGYDVNAPLLNAIASESRAASTFVLPKEDVEAKVSQLFRRLSGPVFADPELTMLDSSGHVTTRAVKDLMPATLNDLFEGDQIVLLGQYQDDLPLRFKINGNYLGTARSFEFKFDTKAATMRNSYVPRLWASRRIAYLIDQIRQMGADRNQFAKDDARVKELVDEIVRLSTKFGILTEYTAFLATEGDLAMGGAGRREYYLSQAEAQVKSKAAGVRSGVGGVSQEMNVNAQKAQATMNRSNVFYDQNMKRVEIRNVQQIADRTFFKRGNRWVEAQLLEREKDLRADQEIEFGTVMFDEFVARLVKEGRQGMLALGSDLLLTIDGRTILVKMPSDAKTQ
ncbi:MAG: VWA domain-containing protein [Acidobacteria bacterium]|nr:VWA domain-containing protein [Acidobacteriota bacterium]